MSESKYFSPKDIIDFYNRQDALSDTERWALDASFWARAMLANYHGYSKEIPAVELKDGKFFVNTSKGRIEVPYNYKDLHSMYNIQERKVLKVDTNEPDDSMMQNLPQDNTEMDGGENPMQMEEPVMDDGQTEMPNQFDTNFDAGVEADEETDPKRYIQQLAGKLSQSLRSYNSELPSPDIDLNKYVMGMINKQALKGMNDKDVNDVLSKIKGDEEEDDMENYDMEDSSNEQPEDDMNQNESVKRDVINELFQELIGNDDNINRQIKDKPITNIGYRKKPFTSPSFK